MLAGLLDHHKAEFPHYKRIVKKKLQDAALAGASRAGRYKNQYIDDWKTHPKEMALLTGIAAITGVSLGLAYVYRQELKKYDGFWVEFQREWLDELDAGKFLVFKVDGDFLLAKTMNQDGTP